MSIFNLPDARALTALSQDGRLLFTTRIIRLFAYGLLSVVWFSISQMDVPARQSYVKAVVQSSECSATAGITGIARTVGAACSPLLRGLFLNVALLSLSCFITGGLKIIYDRALYHNFRRLKPSEEQAHE